MQKAIRVLVVDDSKIMRAALRVLFSREQDIELVAEAGDGESALALACACAPDLVLMELCLPGLDAIEATGRILRECPGARVLVFSSRLERRFVAQALEYGALGYVCKTSGSNELLQGLRAVAQGKRYQCRETATMMDATKQAVAAGEPALAHSEIEVLRRIADGESATDIGSRLGLAPGAVEIHRRNAMRKLGLSNLDELRQYALGTGLARSQA